MGTGSFFEEQDSTTEDTARNREGKIRRISLHLKCSRASSPLELSVCQGILPAATLTLDSEVADVGLRPVWKGQLDSRYRVRGVVTKVEPSKTEGTRHDC